MERLDKKGIEEILLMLDKEISKSLDQPPIKFSLIAVGGTALTLKDIKASTKDVDFMLEGIVLEKLKAYIRKIYEKKKCKIDVWLSPNIFSTTLVSDYAASPYGKTYRNFDVSILNFVDNAVAKLARFNEADREDIDSIIKAGASVTAIGRRFQETDKHGSFGNKQEALGNFELFRKIYGLDKF